MTVNWPLMWCDERDRSLRESKLRSRSYRHPAWRLTAAGHTLDGKGLPGLSDLRRITGADGIIAGSVTHYDKTFVGVAARISVGVSPFP